MIIDYKFYYYCTEKWQWLTISDENYQNEDKNSENEKEINLIKFQV